MSNQIELEKLKEQFKLKINSFKEKNREELKQFNEEKRRIIKIKNEQAKITSTLQYLQNQKQEIEQMRG